MEQATTHPLYSTWRGIIDRCTNPKNPAYYNYGGRGIKVCERWIQSFEDFCSDMGERPSRGYTVDRMENDGDYEPNNCYWATAEQQAANRRPYKRFDPPRGDVADVESWQWDHFWSVLREHACHDVWQIDWDTRALPPMVANLLVRMGIVIEFVPALQTDDFGSFYRIRFDETFAFLFPDLGKPDMSFYKNWPSA